MNRFAALAGRFAVTLVMVALATTVGWRLWIYYMDAPWTRDGHVRADIVELAPDVSGLVSDVLVHDNQPVRRGQPLFHIDAARFELALRVAQAQLDSRASMLAEAQREATRYHALNSLSVSQETQQQKTAALEQAQAAYQEALADRDTAKLNLDRTAVSAPVNGVITNFSLQPGNYVSAGHAVTALVDTDTLRVDGYFEETKLAAIHIGDPVTVTLMGHGSPLRGHVQSIAGGIVDRDRSDGSNLLADVTPTFSWVRLAQRVPVRVTLDAAPAGLLPGLTATVVDVANG
jgi:multidrug resistance efflux pump